MPKPYKKREFEYHFSQDDENTIFNFKKEYSILLAFIFPKERKFKKWFSPVEIITIMLVIIVIIIILLFHYKII